MNYLGIRTQFILCFSYYGTTLIDRKMRQQMDVAIMIFLYTGSDEESDISDFLLLYIDSLS